MPNSRRSPTCKIFSNKTRRQSLRSSPSGYDPLYSEPTREEWAKLSGLLKHKRLPGRKKSGLLPAQKHVAIAASRAIRELDWVDIVAEMGCGKTAMSLATLELLPDAYPAIVLSPGHIVSKWAREIEEVVPGAKGVVVDSLADLMTLAETYQHGDKVVAVMSKERAKLGSGWESRRAEAHSPRTGD